MEQDKHEEGARHRFASEHDERQGQSLEEAAQKKKGRGKIVFGFFGKLSLKAKLAVFAAAAAIAVAVGNQQEMGVPSLSFGFNLFKNGGVFGVGRRDGGKGSVGFFL